MMPCPDNDAVLDYLGRRLGETAREAFDVHVDGCGACRALLVEIAHARELDDTLAPDPAREPVLADGATDPLSNLTGERYELGETLGRGGMGEVKSARDTRIQRDVAVKLVRDPRDNALLARFVREARVQGGLEHPAVVPVHDLGIDRDGRPYFVMKRVAGTTLEDLIARVGADDERTRRQLLARLVEVCLAVEFAHTRGVIHRDLKPANIMLGDFGEAYVLDWGLAKLVGEHEPARADAAEPAHSTIATQVGQLLGTIGYMPPEQLRGETVTTSADVFALGCILFEILAGTRAIADRDPDAAAAATLEAASHRPSLRAPDRVIPPELDDACARATAREPGDRGTARALGAAIQSYLDGDRDLARRRELADGYAELAGAALRDTPGERGRATAMHQAGRALAIDPDHSEAQGILARLMLEAPDHLPAEALASAVRERVRARRAMLRAIAPVFFALAATIPLFLLFPMREHGTQLIFALCATNAVMGAICAWVGSRDVPLRTPWYFVLLATNAFILFEGGLAFGPLLVMPMFFVGSLCAWLILPTGYPPWVSVVGHAAAVIPLVALELLHVLPSTFYLDDHHHLVLAPPAIELVPVQTAIMLVLTFVGQCANMIFVMAGASRARDAVQDQVHAHYWHLEQLLPLPRAPTARDAQ